MKTLFERLKPEVLKSFELEAETYPSTMERLKETLSNMNYYVELRIADASRLLSLGKPFAKFDLEDLSNLFEVEE